MKFRTALRVLAGLAYKKYSAPHRLNQTYEDWAWIDLEIPEISEEIVKELETETNEILKSGIEPTYSTISKEEFMKNETLMASIKGKVPDLSMPNPHRFDLTCVVQSIFCRQVQQEPSERFEISCDYILLASLQSA